MLSYSLQKKTRSTWRWHNIYLVRKTNNTHEMVDACVNTLSEVFYTKYTTVLICEM